MANSWFIGNGLLQSGCPWLRLLFKFWFVLMPRVVTIHFFACLEVAHDKGTMIYYSVSRPPRALIFSSRRKKKILSLPHIVFCQISGPWSVCFPEFPPSAMLSHRRECSLSIFLYFSLQAIPQDVWIPNRDSKRQQEIIPSYEKEKLDCMY